MPRVSFLSFHLCPTKVYLLIMYRFSITSQWLGRKTNWRCFWLSSQRVPSRFIQVLHGDSSRIGFPTFVHLLCQKVSAYRVVMLGDWRKLLLNHAHGFHFSLLTISFVLDLLNLHFACYYIKRCHSNQQGVVQRGRTLCAQVWKEFIVYFVFSFAITKYSYS